VAERQNEKVTGAQALQDMEITSLRCGNYCVRPVKNWQRGLVQISFDGTPPRVP
jgi:hypothetical protein